MEKIELPQDVLDQILLDHRFDSAEDRRLQLVSKQTTIDANVRIEQRLRSFFGTKNLELIEKKLNDGIDELASDEQNTEGINMLRLNFQRIMWNSLKHFAAFPTTRAIRAGNLDWRFLNPETMVIVKAENRWIGQTTMRALLTHLVLTALDDVTEVILFSKLFNDTSLKLPSLGLTTHYFTVYTQVMLSATDVFVNFHSMDHFVRRLHVAHGFTLRELFDQKVNFIALTNPTAGRSQVAVRGLTAQVEKLCVITCAKALVRAFEPHKPLDGEDDIFVIYSPRWISQHFEFARNEVFVVRSGKLLLTILAWEHVLFENTLGVWELLMQSCSKTARPEWPQNQLVFVNEPEILDNLALLLRPAATIVAKILQKPEAYSTVVAKYDDLTSKPLEWIPDFKPYL